MKNLILVLCLACAICFSACLAYADEISSFAERIDNAVSYDVSFEISGKAYGDNLECRGRIWYIESEKFARIELSGEYNNNPEYTLIVRKGEWVVVTDKGEMLAMNILDANALGYKEVIDNPLYSFLEDMGFLNEMGNEGICLDGNTLLILVKDEEKDLSFFAEINSLQEGAAAKSEESGNSGK